jgi:hypothetical protein
MTSFVRQCAVAALSAVLCPLAMAHSVGLAQVHDLTLVVVDLTPGDGLAAGVSFSNILSGLSVASHGTGTSAFNVLQNAGGSDFDSRSAAAQVPDGLPAIAEAQYIGGNDGAVAAYAYSGLPAYSSAGAQLSYTFTLAPHSELRFSGSLFAMAETAGPNASDQNVLSEATISFTGGTSPSFQALAHVTGAPGDGSASNTRNFSFVFTNNGDAALSGSLSTLAQVTASQSVVVVPEPGTAWLLLAGLPLLAGLAARRRMI